MYCATKLTINMDRTAYQNKESNYMWTTPFQLLYHKQANPKSFKNKFGIIISKYFVNILAVQLHVASGRLIVSSSVKFGHLMVTISVKVEMYTSLSLMLDIKNKAGVTVYSWDI